MAYDKLSDKDKILLRNRHDMVYFNLQRRALQRALDAELTPDTRLARLIVRQGPPKFFWFGDVDGDDDFYRWRAGAVKWFRNRPQDWNDMIDQLREDGWDEDDLEDYLLPATDPNFIGEDAWDEMEKWIDENEVYQEMVQDQIASNPDIKIGDWVYVYPVYYPSRPSYGLGRVSDGGKVVTNEGGDPSDELPGWVRQELAKQGTLTYPGQPRFELTEEWDLRLIFQGEQRNGWERF